MKKYSPVLFIIEIWGSNLGHHIQGMTFTTEQHPDPELLIVLNIG